MRQKKFILFDLDGTLTDSAPGIIHSVQHALQYYHISDTDMESLNRFIGPPIRDSFIDFYGFSKEKADEAVEKYREYFSVKGKYENSVYQGIPNVLETLKSHGKRLLVATAKPQVFAEDILSHFGLIQYFDFISGATLDASRASKEKVIAYALEHFPVTNLQEAVMIGDRSQDVAGAKENGLDVIGVRYGYAKPGELEEAGADEIAETVPDLLKIIQTA